MIDKKDVLIGIISGKRPGGVKERPTEKYKFEFDTKIFSNNSEGYQTDLDIENVPKEFEENYKKHFKTSDLAYYAPMNRSWAIRYAKDHGYKYLIQLDDNITHFEIRYKLKNGKYYSASSSSDEFHKEHMANDMIKYLIEVLENTNAGMTGMDMQGTSTPGSYFLKERYVYSVLCMKLSAIPDDFQGDFEDDIEFRYKLKQKQIPTVQVPMFRYAKTAQRASKGDDDSSGNRAAYDKIGINRGANTAKLYGELYKRGISKHNHSTIQTGVPTFKHKIKGFKVGILIRNKKQLQEDLLKVIAKYKIERPTALKAKEVEK